MKLPYHSQCSNLAGAAGLFFLGLSLPALAQQTSQSSTSSSSAFPIGILIIWLCARRRKKPIGGWLAFFFYQVVIGLLVTIIFTIAGLPTIIQVYGTINFVTFCLLFQRHQKVLFCSALLGFQWGYCIIVI